MATQIDLWIEKIREPAAAITRCCTWLGSPCWSERRSRPDKITQFTEDRDALVVTDRVAVPVAELDAVRDRMGDVVSASWPSRAWTGSACWRAAR